MISQNTYKQGHNKSNKQIIYWKKEEDNILLAKAREFGYKNWKEISSFIQGKSAIQCSSRYKRIRPGLKKGLWSKEEDHKLIELVQTLGKNWSLLSQYMPNRSGKQIRDRYTNNHDPNIKKDKFSKDEDDKIIDLYRQYGPSWSFISTKLKRRTGDMIKNRFYSVLKRILETNYIKNEKSDEYKNYTNNSSEIEFEEERLDGNLKDINKSFIQKINNEVSNLKEITKFSKLHLISNQVTSLERILKYNKVKQSSYQEMKQKCDIFFIKEFECTNEEKSLKSFNEDEFFI
jgi:hypothetical protein